MDFVSSTRAAEGRTRWKLIVVMSFVVSNDPARLWDRPDYARRVQVRLGLTSFESIFVLFQ